MMTTRRHSVSTFITIAMRIFNSSLRFILYIHIQPQNTGEANKQLADYRYKLQRAEQEIASLQSSLSRSETQVIRFKGSADASEKAETDLKSERRKLQREVRDISGLVLFVRCLLVSNASQSCLYVYALCFTSFFLGAPIFLAPYS